MTAADKYYLKARENYPYNLDDALEALEYGLSHDETHAGLLTLMGRIYHNDLRQFDAARESFELALYHDAGFVDAYYAYIRFALWMNELASAEKLIAMAIRVKGIDKARIFYFEAVLMERQEKYQNAIDTLKRAKIFSMDKECYSYYDEEIQRIELKDKNLKDHKAPIKIIVKSG